MNPSPATAPRIERFGLTTPDAGRLADFYQKVFGCVLRSSERVEGAAFENLMQVGGGARRLLLSLGAQHIELLQFDHPGQPYPEPLSALDNVFQHFALVVRHMPSAVQRLAGTGCTALSTDGAQRLPPEAGGVTAFKFRDPDGHPLEFLEFPAQSTPRAWSAAVAVTTADTHDAAAAALFPGIDHTALSVRDAQASIGFYRGLGLTVAARHRNQGPEQARLDGMVDPQVDVVALQAGAGPPHVELLGYRSEAPRRTSSLRSEDTAATRIVFRAGSAADAPAPELQRECITFDPDGHRLHWLPARPPRR